MHMDNPNEPIPESDPNDKTPTAGLLSSKVSNGETICPRGLYFVGKFIRTEFNELKLVRNFRRWNSILFEVIFKAFVARVPLWR